MDARTILHNLQSDGAYYRVRGILQCVDSKIVNPEIVSALKKLKTDNIMILGYPVYAYACAALHCLNIELYEGTDDFVLWMIPDLPDVSEGFCQALLDQGSQ